MIIPKIPVFAYSVINQANDTVDIHIDGDIVDASSQEFMQAFFGDETSTSYKSFRNQVEKANPKIVNLYINSPGGHVGDAMAIHDYLIDLETKGVTVNRIGRGIVASAATYPLMGKNSEMSENSFMMIHNVHLVAYGDLVQVKNQVATAEKFNNRIRDFYSEESKNPKETISAWMNKETWMTAQEAKDRGFIKNVTGKVEFENSISEDKFPFQNLAILNKYNSSIKNHENMDYSKVSDAVKNALQPFLDKLGLSNKKDDADTKQAFDDLSNAIVNVLKEQLPDEAKIKELVNVAMNNAMKTVGENESIKTLVTNSINEATKNLANKTDIKKHFDDMRTELIDSIADKLGDASNSDKDKNKDKNKKKGGFKNYFEEYEQTQEWQPASSK